MGSRRTPETVLFEDLYRALRPALVRQAARLGATDSEGMADLALLDGWRALGQGRIEGNQRFEAYVRTALRSRVASEQRRPQPIPVGAELVVEHHGFDPADEVAWRLLIDDLVGELPAAQRSIIEEGFYNDKSAPVIADELGLTANAVHQLRHRALVSLRRALVAALAAVIVVGGLWLLARPGARTLDISPADRSSASTTETTTGQTITGQNITTQIGPTTTSAQSSTLPQPSTTSVTTAVSSTTGSSSPTSMAQSTPAPSATVHPSPPAEAGATTPESLEAGSHPRSPLVTSLTLDFGTETSPSAPDSQLVHPHTDTELVQWTGTARNAADRGPRADLNALNRDLVYGSGSSTLRLRIGDGAWWVTINMGDADFGHDTMTVEVEDQVVSGISVPAGSFHYITADGSGPEPGGIEVSVTDGVLDITFDDAGGVDANWVVTRLSAEWLGPVPDPGDTTTPTG